MSKTLYVSWEEFDEMVTELAERITQLTIQPKYIYGIPRGGLILAVVLSHKLKIPLSLTKPKKPNVLIVDDVSDEGKSLIAYTQIPSSFITATLFVKEETRFIPDFYLERVGKDVWISLPWEEKDAPQKRNNALSLFDEKITEE